MINKIFNVLFMPFKYLYLLIRLIVTSIYKGLRYILKVVISIFRNIILGIAWIIKTIYKLIFNVFKYTFLGIKVLFKSIYKLIFITLKYILMFFKYIFLGIIWVLKQLYKGIYNILVYILMFFKYVLNGFVVILKSIYKYLLNICKYIIAFFKYMLLGIKWLLIKFYKSVISFFVYLVKGLKYVFILFVKLLAKILEYFLEGLYGIYDGIIIFIKKFYKVVFGYPIKAYKNFQEKLRIKREEQARKREALNKRKKQILIEKKAKEEKLRREKQDAKEQRNKNVQEIRKVKAESRLKARAERKSISEQIKNWYNNLSFIKDRSNRKELKRQTLLLDFEGEDAVRSEEKILYKYVAKNNETGKIEKGVFAAFSKLDVHSYLMAEGYEVYEITPQKRLRKNSKGGAFIVTKIKKSDLVFFLTQLSTFLKSGVTLVDSVKIMEKQTKKLTYKQLYKAIIYELTMGENFSDALSKQGDSFPKLLTNMIKTSELTGNLPETLDDMANYYQETEKTRKQMVSAMTYPIVIFLFATVIVVFIMIYVIPQFVDIYSGLETELPPITQIVIGTSHFIQKNVLYLIIGAIGAIIGFRILYNSIKVFKTLIQWVMMHLPIFGNILIYNEVTMFTKTFGSLLNHNVFITDSMEVLSKITNNEIYKMLIFDTITNLAKGEAISNSFKNHWAFPIVAYEMLLTGEKTGQLGDMMNKVSVYYQEQHRNAVNQIKVFIEPVMIVFLALVVGTILLSVILPMFSMYSAIS